jgi:hypothetical protein
MLFYLRGKKTSNHSFEICKHNGMYFVENKISWLSETKLHTCNLKLGPFECLAIVQLYDNKMLLMRFLPFCLILIAAKML